MLPLAVWSNHAEADCSEQPVETDDDGVKNGKDSPLDLLIQSSRYPIHTEAHDDNCEPESRVVVVNVRDTTHGNKWEVVQNPTDDGIDTRVVNLVDVGLLQVGVATLPAHGVEDDDETEDAETGGTSPVDEWITEKEVFDDCHLLDTRQKWNVEVTYYHRSNHTYGDRHSGEAIARKMRQDHPACQGRVRGRCWRSSWRRSDE